MYLQRSSRHSLQTFAAITWDESGTWRPAMESVTLNAVGRSGGGDGRVKRSSSARSIRKSSSNRSLTSTAASGSTKPTSPRRKTSNKSPRNGSKKRGHALGATRNTGKETKLTTDSEQSNADTPSRPSPLTQQRGSGGTDEPPASTSQPPRLSLVLPTATVDSGAATYSDRQELQQQYRHTLLRGYKHELENHHATYSMALSPIAVALQVVLEQEDEENRLKQEQRMAHTSYELTQIESKLQVQPTRQQQVIEETVPSQAADAASHVIATKALLLESPGDQQEQKESDHRGPQMTNLTTTKPTTRLAQVQHKQSKHQPVELASDGIHAWLFAKGGYGRQGFSVVFLYQLTMYLGMAAAIHFTSDADGVCNEEGGGSHRTALSRGSWFTGLILVLGRRLYWAAEVKGVELLAEDFGGHGPILSFGATAQLLDVSGWLAGAPGTDGSVFEPICAQMLQNDITSIAWSILCIMGWYSAWESVFATTELKHHQVSLLALCNPIGLLHLLVTHATHAVLFGIFRVAPAQAGSHSHITSSCVHIALRLCAILVFWPYILLWLLVAHVHESLAQVPYTHLLSHVQSTMTRKAVSRTTYITGVLTVVLLAVYLSAIFDAGGLGGLTTGMIIAGLGGLMESLSVDRALWVLWWLDLLLLDVKRLKTALNTDGFHHHSGALALIVVVLYFNGRNPDTEKHLERVQWLEPLGVLVGRIKAVTRRTTAAFSDNKFFELVRSGDTRGVQATLSQMGAESGTDIVQTYDDSSGSTPLHIAAFYNYVNLAAVLVDHGADLAATNRPDGETALIVAARVGHVDVVEILLLSAHAPLDASVSGGWTPLTVAAKHGHFHVVQCLLQHGGKDQLQYVSTDKMSAREGNALYWAAAQGHADVVALLLDSGAEINQQNNQGWTALHVASHHGHGRVIEVLLQRQADVNIATSDGILAEQLQRNWAMTNATRRLETLRGTAITDSPPPAAAATVTVTDTGTGTVASTTQPLVSPAQKEQEENLE